MEASFNGNLGVQYLDRKKFAKTPTMEFSGNRWCHIRQIPIQLIDVKRTFVFVNWYIITV